MSKEARLHSSSPFQTALPVGTTGTHKVFFKDDSATLYAKDGRNLCANNNCELAER